jgi:DHA1 family bicyclomycin/chloramphenicol resistance-like MFS transporter
MSEIEKSKRRFLLPLMLLVAPLSGAGIDIYVPSLPDVAEHFNSTPTGVQLTIPIYLISFGLSQPIFGGLADTLGRRPPLLFGLALFVMGSLVAATAGSLTELQLARVLQGIGVAGPAVLSKTVATDAFEAEARRRATGALSMAWAGGPVLAPFLGGYLHQAWGWQGPFLFLAVTGTILLILCGLCWPETRPEPTPLRLGALVANFAAPLTTLSFLRVVAGMAASYSLITIFNVAGPFLIQEGLGYSVVDFGHLALALGAFCLIGTVLNQRLEQTWRERVFLGLTIATVVSSGLSIALFKEGTFNLWTVLLPSMIGYLLVGMAVPLLMVEVLSAFPKAAGSASATAGTLLILGSGLASGAASLARFDSPEPLAWSYLILSASLLLLSRRNGRSPCTSTS